jgi:hypothetical protein
MAIPAKPKPACHPHFTTTKPSPSWLTMNLYYTNVENTKAFIASNITLRVQSSTIVEILGFNNPTPAITNPKPV